MDAYTYDPAPYIEAFAAFADPSGDMPEYCTTIRGFKIAVYELDGAMITTGTPKTHKEVARLAVEFAWSQMEES